MRLCRTQSVASSPPSRDQERDRLQIENWPLMKASFSVTRADRRHRYSRYVGYKLRCRERGRKKGECIFLDSTELGKQSVRFLKIFSSSSSSFSSSSSSIAAHIVGARMKAHALFVDDGHEQRKQIWGFGVKKSGV